ncbi:MULTISPECIES: RNA polymerase sigma factor [unclassified Streptomyces]|uniref:RNA polymerase sigma factor n=1 Tax=unclassified Streptomyces TaxID=2593676 RepID=UPI0033309CEE
MSNEAPRTRDEAGFEAFFGERFTPTVFRLMARESRLAQADAEDIVSAAFWETSENWSKIRDPEGYLWDRVAKRHIDFWRKLKTREAEHLCDPAESIATKPAPEGEEPEQCVGVLHLRELIGKLSTDDQRVINMESWGVSHEDVAKALGVTEGTYRVRLHRAKRRLEKLVNEEAGGQR